MGPGALKGQCLGIYWPMIMSICRWKTKAEIPPSTKCDLAWGKDAFIIFSSMKRRGPTLNNFSPYILFSPRCSTCQPRFTFMERRTNNKKGIPNETSSFCSLHHPRVETITRENWISLSRPWKARITLLRVSGEGSIRKHHGRSLLKVLSYTYIFSPSFPFIFLVLSIL